MNIGIVTEWFDSGVGYLSRQYRDALSSGHNIFIYGRAGARRAVGHPEWDDESVTWGALPPIDEPDAVDIKDFDSWIRKRQLDVVFFNEQRWWQPVVLCAQRNVVCGAYVVHYTKEAIPFYDCYDFLVCNTRHHYEVFRDHAQAAFIPWGTNITRFRPATSEAVNNAAVTFFHSAGLDPYRKGTELVIRAFSRLRAGKASPRLIVHMHPKYDIWYGRRERTRQESLKQSLEPLLKEGKLQLVTEAVPDLAELYRMGDVFVYPTRHEGLGLGVAEALASGLPIIVTDAKPVNEHADGHIVRPVLVQEYWARTGRRHGDYWPEAKVDVNALAEAMQWFVDNPEQLSALKRDARRFAEEKLNWAQNASTLPEFFASVRKIDSPTKRAALEEANESDNERIRLGLRNWVGARYPWAISLGRMLKLPSKSRTR